MTKIYSNFSFQYCTDYSESNILQFEYELILRKWENINPSMEFRVFVGRNEIIGIFYQCISQWICLQMSISGICQRDVRSYYSHIHRDKEQIVNDIFNFYNANIRNKFSIDSCKYKRFLFH